MYSMGIFYILDFIGIILLLKWFRNLFRIYKATPQNVRFFTLKRFQIPIISSILIWVPVLAVNFTDIENRFRFPEPLGKEFAPLTVAFAVSSFISLMWLVYLYKLDIYSKEKKRHILFVFLFSALLTIFVPYIYRWADHLGVHYSPVPVLSFFYSVFVIGFIEESVKFIPVLLLLKFSKAIDESFDYILFASISALGFAWIENTTYLYRYGIGISNARCLYASVLHMASSSLIAYGLFMAKYKQTRFPPFWVMLAFYFLAIFTHGFYDFWYLTPTLKYYDWISTLFLLILIHLWFSIKNNTLNMSEFYDQNRKLNNEKLKRYLSVGLLGVFMFSYFYSAVTFGSKKANLYFNKNLLIYGYTIFYIITTITEYHIVPGLVKPFAYTLKFLIPGWKSKDKKS